MSEASATSVASNQPVSSQWRNLASLEPRGPRRLRRYAMAMGYVVASALLAWALSKGFHSDRVSMIFLAGPLLAAMHLGAEAAIIAALAAFALYNFYLVDPKFTIRLAEPEDYFTLAAFLAVALLTGGLAGRLRDEHRKSAARARGLAVLFEASHELSASESEAVLLARLAAKLSDTTGYDAWAFPAGEPIGPRAAAQMRPEQRDQLERLLASWRGGSGGADVLASGPWRLRPMNADGRELGAALWRLPEPPNAQTLELNLMAKVLTDLGATALARARMGVEKAEAEAVAEAERLRTALLSSISHDFRTPLAAVLASASSLIEFGDRFDVATRKDLLFNIQEEAERLNRFVANLLNMTRLESGVLELRLSPVSTAEAVSRAVERLRRRSGERRFVIQAEAPDLMVLADPLLLDQVLTNLVENALTFSPDASEILVRTTCAAGRVELSVIDAGDGVPEAETPRLFDKFYRASNARRSARGSGLGLAICKGLVEAMGGSIAARPREDGSGGLCVVVALPVATLVTAD